MSDELRAAIVRVRLCQQEGPDVAYPNAKGGEYIRDMDTLTEAYLAEHPADDGEPVTEEWLRSVGFVRMQQPAAGNDMILRNEAGNCLTYYPARRGDPAGPLWGVVGEWLPKPLRPATRGDVRRLLLALGITPTPKG